MVFDPNQSQIKSKHRVEKHGEVFTNPREVNAMLDLVKQETERIDSRFLEPACGDGNFLAEILRRKLAVVKKKYGKSPSDYEKYAVLAATSIYGVDILRDNVEACRERMFEIWDKGYQAVLKREVNEDTREAVRFIFFRNIICGNALSLKKVDADGNDTEEPIVFSFWAYVTGLLLKREDYTFDKLLKGDIGVKNIYARERTTPKLEQHALFDAPETGASDDEGELLKQNISHYRSVQHNG